MVLGLTSSSGPASHTNATSSLNATRSRIIATSRPSDSPGSLPPPPPPPPPPPRRIRRRPLARNPDGQLPRQRPGHNPRNRSKRDHSMCCLLKVLLSQPRNSRQPTLKPKLLGLQI